MPTNADEMSDLADRLSKLTPEQLDEVKRRTTPAPAKFSARQEPQTDRDAFLASMKRAIEAGIREGLGADVGTFKASTSRSAPPDGPERLAGDAEDELDDLDDAQARRILREFMYDVELGAAARRALREFRQLRASASGIHCTRMGPERFIQAHPAVLEALGVASFHGNG